MSKLFWSFVVFVLVLMVDQTEGWRRRRRRRRCPVHPCSVSSWGWWSSCSRSCGWGRQVRSRTVTGDASCGGGCPYSLSGSQSCNKRVCPGKGGLFNYTIAFLPWKQYVFFSFLGQVRRSEQKHNYKQRTHVQARTRVNALLWGMRMDMPARHLQLK